MADLETLRDLETRLIEAEKPDRDLDRELNVACGLDMNKVIHRGYLLINAYTQSIDAALALIERMLPMPGYSLQHAYGGMGGWMLRAGVGAHGTEFIARRDDREPALALLTALVRALIAQQEEGRG